MTYSQNMIDGLNLLKKLETIMNEAIADTYTKARLNCQDDNMPNVEVAEIWQKAIYLNNDLLSARMHIDYIRSVLIRMRPSEEMNNENN